MVERCSCKRSTDPGRAEGQSRLHSHAASAVVRGKCGERGDADQNQTRRCGLLGTFTGGVHESGHRKDGSSAAERADGKADQKTERGGGERAYQSPSARQPIMPPETLAMSVKPAFSKMEQA